MFANTGWLCFYLPAPGSLSQKFAASGRASLSPKSLGSSAALDKKELLKKEGVIFDPTGYLLE
ncbi:3058_t:CDS:2, partial [Racocetra persica]